LARLAREFHSSTVNVSYANDEERGGNPAPDISTYSDQVSVDCPKHVIASAILRTVDAVIVQRGQRSCL
jgi:hypothetical protein